MTATATAPSQRFNFTLGNVEARALAKLPKPALEKLEHLKDVETRMTALRNGLYESYNTARENFGAAQLALTRFDREYPAPTQIVDDGEGGTKRVEVPHPEREPLVAQVERFRNEMARITAQQGQANPGFSTKDILEWLAANPAKFVMAPAPKVAITGSLADTLASIRMKQSEAREALIEVQNAPATAQEAKARMRAEVAALAALGAPDINPLFYNHPVGWPAEILRVDGAGVHQYTSVATVKNAFALTVWLHSDAIVKRLEEDIDAAADETALSSQDREARITQLNTALLLLERQEEAIIIKIEMSGGAVTRTTTLPEILLGIERAKG